MPITIVRPSIIGSSYKYPVPGWVDNVSAAGALFLLGGLGLLNRVQGDNYKFGDIIPVDYVCDTIILAGAYGSMNPGFHVIIYKQILK